MANQKLSQLTELAVEPADVDEIYISDGGTSKRITYGTFKAALLDNATHTGDATGSSALTLQPAAITGKGAVTVAAGDLLLVADISASPQVLGQVTAQSVADLFDASSYLQNVSEDTTPTLGGDLDANGQNVTNLGDVTFQTGAAGGTLRTGTSNADKFQLQAYDVNDATYRTLIEADAGNDVRLQIPADYLDLEDATDTTKIARFDISGVATGTTRTITMPDANVDLGAIATNTAKVTNATHSGDAVGDGALTLQPAAITGKGAVTVDGADLLLVTDVSASPQVLGQVTAQSIANLAPAVQGSAILSSDTSPLVTDGYVLTADGAGGAAWEAAAGGGVDWTTAQDHDLTAATGNEVAFSFTSEVNKATSGNYTGIKLNVTETAAPGTADLLLDLQVGGTSAFTVSNSGDITLGSASVSALRNIFIGNDVDAKIAMFAGLGHGYFSFHKADGNEVARIGRYNSEDGVHLASGAFFGFGSATPANTKDVRFYRDAAANLALRNSTTAQTFRVYTTYTDASNYERLALTGSAITVETAGTGTDDIDLTLTPAGAGVLKFGTHSALSGESVTGYITIKDAAGNSRKLAVVS